MVSMPNVTASMSKLAMGTAGLSIYPQASAVFDAFFEAGGTTFDTAAHYGAGRADLLLGHWLQERGVRDQVAVIGKGAHSPNCFPEAVTRQLNESLERLKTDYIDVYFLHRDNPDVPVGEFVDVLNEHYQSGRIKVFGGSNWTLPRMEEANSYAVKHGLEGFRVLSNQFSLAEMIEPVWPGCVSASDAEAVAWLKRTGVTLFGWSSQARGFFTDRGGRQNYDDPALVRSWYNDVYFARRDRAEALARKYSTTVPAIALAYNLAQDFALFPLIGPVTVDELRSSLAALNTPLTFEEANWLRTGS
jgi:aryl-alcohol dehydrogenase-like predicted oxidoreductase